MIKPIFFTTSKSYTKSVSKNVFRQKSIYQRLPISFSGIMDNPEAKRITDANGNTYIIESGGTLVIHNGDKENKRGVKEALTGAGVGAAGTSMAAKNTNKGDSQTKITDKDDIKPHENTQTEIDEVDVEKDIKSLEDKNPDNYDDIDIDDDDDDSIFDDSHPIYEF